MVEKVMFRSQLYNLILRDEVIDSDNIFTIIVGRNGTGKSRLLSAIVSGLESTPAPTLFNMMTPGFEDSWYEDIVVDREPGHIIAVSPSPFDKFPVPKRGEVTKNYTYLGIRDIGNLNVGVGFMSKIAGALLSSLLASSEAWLRITEVLEYLEYRGHLKMAFSYNPSSEISHFFFNNKDNYKSFFRPDQRATRALNRGFFLDHRGQLDLGKVEELKRCLSDLFYKWGADTSRTVRLSIDKSRIESSSSLTPAQIAFLLNAGFLKLKNIDLVKHHGVSFSINNSSSGEQSVILSILGIASKIKDNTVICIDEPEICLHPQWQEKYIQMLIQVFSRFKSCHFIIATHSPQIVSRLDPTNCFILDMETRTVMPAGDFVNNSIDFQLASVFRSPGYKNEYLTRLAFTIFANVSRSKTFENGDQANLNSLLAAYSFLDDGDPVKDFIDVIKELRVRYA